MKLVIELERVRVLQPVGDELKLWMVPGKTVDDPGVAVTGTGFVKDLPALHRAIVKRRRRQTGGAHNRSLHYAAVSVTGQTGGIRRRMHPARPLMFDMAGPAGPFIHHVRFVEGVSRVALETILVDGGQADWVG